MANARAQSAGLAERCRFELADYRAIKGPFDRIVSVGMFRARPASFITMRFSLGTDLLAPTASPSAYHRSNDGPGDQSLTAKYIFPGGYTRHDEVAASVERSAVHHDVEVLRLHYAEPKRVARAFPKIGRRRRLFTTSASAGCGSSTLPPRK